MIGNAFYNLSSLAVLFDNPTDLTILGSTGGQAGTLKMNIVPCAENGGEIPEEDLIDEA